MSKAEKTKEYIIEKTAPIFNTKGYAGTSLSDMTTATGLTKGSIYGNFENKNDVALAAFDYNLQKISRSIKAEMETKATYTEKLMVYITIYENILINPAIHGGCPILNTAIEADDTHPELKKRAAGAIVKWKNIIEKLITKGIDSKEFKAGINAKQVALTIISLIEGAIMIAKVTGNNLFCRDIMQSVKKQIDDLK